MTTLLLDADILAYMIAAGSQKTTTFPGCEPHVEVADWSDVQPRIHEEVAKVLSTLGAGKVIICLSCPTASGFRIGILPSYKGNRKTVVKPVLLEKIKDYLEANWSSYRKPTLEADDIMGILSTHPTLVPGKRVIVSDDKDMGTIPGFWFRPGWVGRQPDAFVREVTLAEADHYHLYQTLCGDTTDGYTGCPKVGPVKASAVLEVDPSWKAVVDAYVMRGWTEEDALVQARVARICRHTDWNFTDKKVIPWTPASYPCASVATTASTASTQPSLMRE